MSLSKATPRPGRGHRLFIAYASDACGSSHDLSSVWSLASWLQSLGFEVICDSPERNKERLWLRWYTAHFISCENILLVCSPELAQGFQSATPTNYTSSGPSACANLISLIYQKVGQKETHLRVFPVILSSQYGKEFVPTLFSGDMIYHLTWSTPTGFNPQTVRSHFDQLVFRICRLPCPKRAPPVGQIQPLATKKGKLFFPNVAYSIATCQ